MFQSRTHTCNELRLENAGEQVRIVGWMENVREVGGNLAFVVLRDFYGTTQVVVEDEADLKQGLINISSPIARALIGKEEGDTAEVLAPGGVRRYEVVAVSYL